MNAADWHRVLVADLAAQGTRLSKANMVRLSGRATAGDAGLCGDGFAVLPVTKANGSRDRVTTLGNGCFRRSYLESAERPTFRWVRLVAENSSRLRRSGVRLSSLDRVR